VQQGPLPLHIAEVAYQPGAWRFFSALPLSHPVPGLVLLLASVGKLLLDMQRCPGHYISYVFACSTIAIEGILPVTASGQLMAYRLDDVATIVRCVQDIVSPVASALARADIYHGHAEE
jgi:hypothetical protein